ncbi:MAG: hypothetical protein ABR976_00845 [Terracidiphilus sp.]
MAKLKGSRQFANGGMKMLTSSITLAIPSFAERVIVLPQEYYPPKIH